jgi:DNA-binding transcriptional ArsR family regulator
MDAGRFASAADAYDHHVGRYGAQLAGGLVDVVDVPTNNAFAPRHLTDSVSPLERSRSRRERGGHRAPSRSAEHVDTHRPVSICLRCVNAYRTDGLAALGDPTRRAIFERVAEQPRAVVELARGLPVSRPAVSQHLKVLKDAGLVIDRPAGTRRIYQLDPDGVGALRAYLNQFWDKALVAYKTAVEQQQEENS